MMHIKSLAIVDQHIDSRYRSTRHRKEARLYIWPEGETLIDNINNRKERPHKLYRKHVLPKVLEQAGLPADTKARWSQYAGCSCPCSPGFIIEHSDVFGKTLQCTIVGE